MLKNIDQMKNIRLLKIITVAVSIKNQLKFMAGCFQVHTLSAPVKFLSKEKESKKWIVHDIEMIRTVFPAKGLKVFIQKLSELPRKEKSQIVYTHTPKAGAFWNDCRKTPNLAVRWCPTGACNDLRLWLVIYLGSITNQIPGAV